MRNIRLMALTMAIAVQVAPLAFAHAFLDHTLPAVGSTIRTPPRELRLWFTQELESEYCTVRVTDRLNKRLDSGVARTDPHDATILEVPLSELAPGRYRVSWRVVSVDTHVTEGDFTFDVAP
jgi:methionine-rich copper-binding protein CopC